MPKATIAIADIKVGGVGADPANATSWMKKLQDAVVTKCKKIGIIAVCKCTVNLTAKAVEFEVDVLEPVAIKAVVKSA